MRSPRDYPGSFKAIFISLIFSLLTGCSSLHYLWQAGEGQLALSNRARPIKDVVKDPRTPPRVAKLLGEISEIKKFGEENGLKPTNNYTEYVKLDRPAAVWVVSASAPLEFKSLEWHFPFVGSFPYLGWFDLNDAKDFAESLKKEGYDVDLRGARAYSTLGWFRDSILSSMIPEGPEALGDLVNVVIHESVHATIYVSGQAYFDESLASYVAGKLTPVYLEKTRGATSEELKAYNASEEESEKIEKRLHEAFEKLKNLYASSRPDSEKLAEKSHFLTMLKNELGFKRDINNATLVQFKEYNVGMDDFEKLYKACGNSLDRFMTVLKTITPKSFSKPQQDDLAPVLGPLAAKGCSA